MTKTNKTKEWHRLDRLYDVGCWPCPHSSRAFEFPRTRDRFKLEQDFFTRMQMKFWEIRIRVMAWKLYMSILMDDPIELPDPREFR